jgi:hypothetical protein
MASRSRLIAINATGGALVAILATGPTCSIEVREDDLAAATGFAYQSAEDNFATLNTLATTSEPLQIPNVGRYPMHGPLLGLNAQGVAGAFNFTAATTLLKAISKAGATTLRFIEND